MSGPRSNQYAAVGITRAVESAMGFARRPTSAFRMLLFVTPLEVRRNFNPFLLASSLIVRRIAAANSSERAAAQVASQAGRRAGSTPNRPKHVHCKKEGIHDVHQP